MARGQAPVNHPENSLRVREECVYSGAKERERGESMDVFPKSEWTKESRSEVIGFSGGR